MLGSQAFKPFRPRATREFRPPVDNGTRRLSTSMGVDDAKRLDFVGDCHAGMVTLRDGREQLDLVPFRGSATYKEPVLRRAADCSIPTRSVSEGQFRRSLTYVSGYDW
jgi:hypothetical protein